MANRPDSVHDGLRVVANKQLSEQIGWNAYPASSLTCTYDVMGLPAG